MNKTKSERELEKVQRQKALAMKSGATAAATLAVELRKPKPNEKKVLDLIGKVEQLKDWFYM